jgi:hypothetical protein
VVKVHDGVVTRRIFQRRWRRAIVALTVAALTLAVVAVLAWWNPAGWRLPWPGWVGTEQTSWVAGIAAAMLALASFVGDRLDARRETRAGRARVDRVLRVGRIPRRAAWRQDRTTDIDVAKAARAGHTAVLTQVLSGLGGVGKTQLAAQFARGLDAAGELDVLVWCTAASRDAIVAGYAETAYAAELCGPEIEPQAAAARLLGWLEQTDRRWLIVLDNLDTPADATGLWPPENRNGRTVVTTRSRDPILHTDRRTLVPVDLFTPHEAAEYLTRATGSEAEAEALAADLGYLPLAVAQAAAFIRDRGIDCATCRQWLRDRRRTLDDLAPPTMPDDYQRTVAATWSLSIEAADTQPPRGLAGPLLNIAALLDPNGVPSGVFTTDAVTTYLTRVVGRDVTAEKAVDGLRNLHRLNLITQDPEDGTVRVHTLVQRAVRDATGDDQQPALAAAAADALLELWPPVERDAAHAQPLRANAAALQTTSRSHLWQPDTGAHPLQFQAGNSFGAVGLVDAAHSYFEQLYAIAADRLGSDHPDTLSIRHNLAWCQGEAGDPVGAAEATEQLLADQLRILGPDHPDTLIIRNELAYWRGQAGDLVGAAEACEALLTDLLRILGSDHLHTLDTRENLAMWQALAGDPAGAAEACEALLTDELRILGPDHPATLSTRNNLANWIGRAGNPSGAAEACEALLTDELRILGPDRPTTLATRTNIAYWRGNADGAAVAVVLLEPLAADMHRILGPDHPDTLETRGQLALRRGEVGDVAAATTMCTQVISDCVRVLGPDHRHTLSSRNVLANLRGLDSDPVTAVTMLKELLTDQLRLLGPEHFLIDKTRKDIVHWRRQITD